jgi:hypothetical protein
LEPETIDSTAPCDDLRGQAEKTCRVQFDIGTRRISLNLQREQLETSRINQMWTGTLAPVHAMRQSRTPPGLDAAS